VHGFAHVNWESEKVTADERLVRYELTTKVQKYEGRDILLNDFRGEPNNPWRTNTKYQTRTELSTILTS
jgi:hypothetical protein